MLTTKDLAPAAVLDYNHRAVLACLQKDETLYGNSKSNGLLLARHILNFVTYPATLAPSLGPCLELPIMIDSI